MARNWKDAGDCVDFWSTDYKDDVAAKLWLMQQMKCVCFKCSPPKERLLGERIIEGGPLSG